MSGCNAKRFALGALVTGVALACVGAQLACHRGSAVTAENKTEPPLLSYRTPVMLATAGEPFTSVAGDASTFVTSSGVGYRVTTGFSFAIAPALPSGLALDPATGVIAGTPAAVSASLDPLPSYVVTAVNSAGAATFTLQLGAQAASPVVMAYGGTAAVSTVVDAAMVLPGPTVAGGVPDRSAFAVAPALPAGLTLNPLTGTVTGAAGAALPATAYTLTLSTPLGSANAGFTLLVSATEPAAPLGLAYPAGPFSAVVGQLFPSLTPTVSGASLAYTVSPALPAGLLLDPLTGVISGTPEAAAAQATYTVLAANGHGTSAAPVVITVAAS